MPQGPIGTLNTALFGSKSAPNLTAAKVIKATPGSASFLHIIAPGSGSGAWTLNDCTTTTAAAAANEVISIPYNATVNAAGSFINLENFPFLVGITLSAVPGAGSPIAVLIYD
jgi:hypothetical protein